MLVMIPNTADYLKFDKETLQWRSEGGQGGASAPGRRPEGGAKFLPKNLKKIYIR